MQIVALGKGLKRNKVDLDFGNCRLSFAFRAAEPFGKIRRGRRCNVWDEEQTKRTLLLFLRNFEPPLENPFPPSYCFLGK
ncbi:hypothetical protein SAMN05444359_10922 [Neolewinella agarilytica]|uniref:Uncharacterized protein n=1 Tax=Neolewinella agarilytica TaxID=478744 RepID=A0A1H9FLR6_9BACT|nr:hypothetical protein SAMN05444359_10922 [Neolewinella agarilytica]